MSGNKNNSTTRDLISGEIGDHNRNTIVGSGITQRDDSRDINQFFGSTPTQTQNQELSELLSLALFGDGRLDFKGVVSEVSALKTEIKNLITQVDTLHATSKHRDQIMSDLKNYIVQLEKEILFLKNKNNKWLEYAIYILIALGSVSSLISLYISVLSK